MDLRAAKEERGPKVSVKVSVEESPMRHDRANTDRHVGYIGRVSASFAMDPRRKAMGELDRKEQGVTPVSRPNVQAKSLFASVKTFGMADKKNSTEEISRGSREDSVMEADVLVGWDADDVVRPYSESWFRETTLALKGEVCKVGLAGGTVVIAAMTQYGEIRFPTGS